MDVYIKVEGLTVSYSKNGSPVFKDLDAEFYKGEMVLIMGPNGGGKTTFLKSIVGLVYPVSGSISVLGRDPFRDLEVRKLIGYVPQVNEMNIYAPLTLWDLVSLGRYPHLGIFKRFSGEDESKVSEAIEKVGLTKYVDYKVSELSGGQLRRGLIAKALAQDPLIYLLDEPFESIDYVSEEVILKVLGEERDRGKLIIIAEHHLTETGHLDRIVLFRHGIIKSGKPDEILTEDVLRLAY